MSIYRPEDRHLPVRPNLDQLKNQAKDLLRAIRRGDPAAIDEFTSNHPQAARFALKAEATRTAQVDIPRLADAQLALARSYGALSWPRLVQACKLIDAIWRDDVQAVADIIKHNPQLLHEDARIKDSNWGPAAKLRRQSWPRRNHQAAFCEPAMRLIEEHGGTE